MSKVSLGPAPFPELTHIMIGLESCSFLVSPAGSPQAPRPLAQHAPRCGPCKLRPPSRRRLTSSPSRC